MYEGQTKKKDTFAIELTSSRAAGRSENSGGASNLVSPIVGIGLTDLPKSGRRGSTPKPLAPTALQLSCVVEDWTFGQA